MKEMYRVLVMTKEEYSKYMSGAMFYDVNDVDIEAENKEEAYEIALKMYPETDFVVNKTVHTVAYINQLIEERRAKWQADKEKEEATKAKAKATKEANEKRKAEELGLTLEEYQLKVKKDRKIQRAENEVRKLEKALAEAKAYLEKVKND